LKGTNPINRTGNYFEDIRLKFAEVLKLSKEYNVDRILHGGDFGDGPMMSLGLIDTIVDMIEENGIEWYVVRGNHDEIGHNPNLSGESILDHIFRRSKIIRHLGARSFEETLVEGFDYYHGIEKDIKEKGLIPSLATGYGRSIAVVHAFITPEPWLPQVLHVPVPEIESAFDLVLVAHNHAEFGVIKQHSTKYGKDTTFVSIGSLSRLTVAKHDIDRIPKVLFIDTEKPSMQVIQLESARPPEQVFDLKKIQEGKSFEASIENFISSLESTKFQGLNLRGVIEELGEKQGYDPEVIKEIVNRMGEFEK
jgi:DNA repair exonuclease SbcCD nuclease subunit